MSIRVYADVVYENVYTHVSTSPDMGCKGKDTWIVNDRVYNMYIIISSNILYTYNTITILS